MQQQKKGKTYRTVSKASVWKPEKEVKINIG